MKDLTGVAAILRFPLPGLDDIDEDTEDSDDVDQDSEEEEKESEGKNFDDDQMELLLNEGMLDEGDYGDEYGEENND